MGRFCPVIHVEFFKPSSQGTWPVSLGAQTSTGHLFDLKGIYTLLGTNLSHKKIPFEDDFPFLKVGYASSLEGRYTCGIYEF